MKPMHTARAWASVLALVGASVGLAAHAAPAGASCAVTVSGISPAVGFQAGGSTTTISGCGFSQTGTLSVSFGANAATPVTVHNDGSLSVPAPAAASAGAVTVTVRLHPSSGSDQTATTTYTYVAPPSISAIVPAKGGEKGGTAVTVTGAHFSPTPGSTAGVKFAAAAATSVTGVSDTGLTAVSPAGTGTVNLTVVVTLPGGATATSNGVSFLYVPAPVVTSVSPASGPPTGGQDVTVVGANFQAGANIFFGPADGSASLTGDTSGSPVSVLDSTHILITTPAGIPGATNVVVLNPDGQSGALKAGASGHYSFTGALPTVTAVTPSSGTSLGATPVTITGSGFLAGATVAFKAAAEADPPTLTGATVSADGLHITGKTPAHPSGAVDLVATNPGGGTVTLAAGYTYGAAAAPTVSTVSPATGGALGGTQVTIAGTNFASGAKVTFGTVDAGGAAVLSSTSLVVRAPAQAAGTVAVKVTNPDGQLATKASAFTYSAAPAPMITSVSPGTGPGGTQVTITGSGFANTNGATTNAISAAVVQVGTATCIPGSTGSTATCLGSLPPVPPSTVSPPIVVNNTKIQGVVPNAPGGAATVKVTNPDGQVATSSFTYTGPSGAPTLTAISPNTGPTLGNTAVTLTGTNFVTGAVVSFAASSRGAPAATTVSANGTTISTVTPAGVYGLVDVTVTNPGGGSVTLKHAFTFATSARPTITSITPSTGASGISVTIAGSGFANTHGATTNAPSAATVTIGGRSLLPPASGPIVTSDTAITGFVPTAPGGAADVAVTNPDGQGAILVNGFTYPTDTTAPTTTATGLVGGVSYTFGTFARGKVAVTLTAADDVGGSGVRSISYRATGAQPIASTTVPVAAGSPSTSFTISADGTTTITFSSTDIAGNVESPQAEVVKVDATPPSITAVAATPGGPYTSGTTTNANVTVTFSCADSTSGVASVTFSASAGSATSSSGTNPLAVTVSSTGTSQSVTGTCSDVAGNTNSVTFSGINITRTTPAITARATVNGSPYTAGSWTRHTVTVVFSCVPISADNQVVSLTSPVQVNGPAENQTVSGTCTDSAGNSSVATFGTASAGIDIDLTLPVPTATATTTDNNGQTVAYLANTWANHDVVVTFACTDPGPVSSGVASISPPVTVSAEGTTSAVTGGCSDVAGNVANPPAFFGPILIDRTPPTCSVIVGPNPIHPPTRQLATVTATVSVNDALSGPSRFSLVAVTSNNPATAAADIAGFDPGTASASGQLRAIFGRVYTLTYQGFDAAGNASPTCRAQVTVNFTG